MKVKNWITVNSRGSARLTKSKPRMEVNEVSIALELNIPAELFQKPRLEAKIDIPKEAVGPDLINSTVVENVQDAIKQATGLTFAINVIKSEEDEDKQNERN